MNQRLVIEVGEQAGQFYCCLPDRQDNSVPFDMNGVSTASLLTVKDGGSKIFEELCKNSGVRKAIERALGGGSQPIYIYARTRPGQAVSWESLWGGNEAGFISLDPSCSIARIAGGDTIRNSASFVAPLRILAVISAEDIPGEPEWRELFDAVQFAMQTGLSVKVHVVTGEAALHAALQAAPPVDWLTIAPVPGTIDELSLEIENFKPHILHFFCHGHVDAGNGTLEILGNVQELQLSIRALTQISALENVWLVVLNACRGGSSQEGLSMAWRIVNDGNVPFAIGAAENVDVRDASRFTRAFYRRLLFSFGESVEAVVDNGSLTLEWQRALHSARDAINLANANKPETSSQWTFPILYEHRMRLQLVKQPAAGAAAPIAADLAALRAKMAAEFLATLAPDTSEVTKKKLVAAILNQPNGT